MTGEEHFSEGQWCDYVRQAADAELKVRMDQHLAENCERCRSANEMWHLVTIVAGREPDYEPNESAVRSVKAAFSIRAKASLLSRSAQMAKLVFDSFREPLPAGVRGGAQAARHLLHEAGPFVIDVWIERETENRMWVAGQILQRDGREHVTSGTAVLFMRGDQVLGQTIANIDGEFRSELVAANDFKVLMQIPNGAQIGIVLPGFDDVPTN